MDLYLMGTYRFDKGKPGYPFSNSTGGVCAGGLWVSSRHLGRQRIGDERRRRGRGCVPVAVCSCRTGRSPYVPCFASSWGRPFTFGLT
jgi:hypothetical protein